MSDKEMRKGIFKNKVNTLERIKAGISLYVLFIISIFNPFYWISKKVIYNMQKASDTECSKEKAIYFSQQFALVISVLTYILAIVIIVIYYMNKKF